MGTPPTHTLTKKDNIMLKILSRNKISSILTECQTPGAVKILSYTKNGVPCEAAATADTIYNIFSSLEFFRALGGKEQPLYDVLPDGNTMLGVISTRPDGQEQTRMYFIVRFSDTNFLN